MNSITRITVAVMVACSVAAATPLVALGTEANVVLCDTSSANHCVFLKNDSGPVSYSGTLPDDGAQITLSASAAAEAGVLHAYASYSMTGPGSFYTLFHGLAEFGDVLTIDGGAALAGTIGYLTPQISVTGSGRAFVGATILDSVNFNFSGYSQRVFGSQVVTLNLLPLKFTYGQPFAMDIDLEADADPGNIVPGLTFTSDFSDTAVLTGLAVMDSNHNPVSNATFTSQLGLSYTQSGIVPEPSTLVLFGCGIAVLLAARRRSIR